MNAEEITHHDAGKHGENEGSRAVWPRERRWKRRDGNHQPEARQNRECLLRQTVQHVLLVRFFGIDSGKRNSRHSCSPCCFTLCPILFIRRGEVNPFPLPVHPVHAYANTVADAVYPFPPLAPEAVLLFNVMVIVVGEHGDVDHAFDEELF